MNWPPYRDWKADVSSVSPSSDEGLTLETKRRANARNVSFSISVQWSIYMINSVDKPNFRVSLPHRRSTTISSETNPLYSFWWHTSTLTLGHFRIVKKQSRCWEDKFALFVKRESQTRPLSLVSVLLFLHNSVGVFDKPSSMAVNNCRQDTALDNLVFLEDVFTNF